MVATKPGADPEIFDRGGGHLHSMLKLFSS